MYAQNGKLQALTHLNLLRYVMEVMNAASNLALYHLIHGTRHLMFIIIGTVLLAIIWFMLKYFITAISTMIS